MATVEQRQPAPTGPLTPRAAARARRRRARADFWRSFRRNKMGMAGLVILLFFMAVAILAPLIANPLGLRVAFAPGKPFQHPSLQFPLGTDGFGRSVLTLTIWGSRTSLLVGFAAAAIAASIGTGVGVAAGYLGGRTDSSLNAVTNWFLVIPWIPLAIALTSILGPTLLNVIIVIGLTSWASTARLVRAQAMSVCARPFVERARGLGSGEWRIVRNHIVPNLVPVIMANLVLAVAVAILSETTLALLGLGDPTRVSWGTMIDEAFSQGAVTGGDWWWLLPPGICIVLVVLGFTMCGYAMEEVLNPRLRHGRGRGVQDPSTTPAPAEAGESVADGVPGTSGKP
jgi:peptide/nickel transport system permease protein